jgi:hypothetical protein
LAEEVEAEEIMPQVVEVREVTNMTLHMQLLLKAIRLQWEREVLDAMGILD